jgi:hypothetical protein
MKKILKSPRALIKNILKSTFIHDPQTAGLLNRSSGKWPVKGMRPVTGKQTLNG